MFPNFLEWAYGQWGNLAGYIYGTAVYYSSDPPKIQEETEEEDKDDLSFKRKSFQRLKSRSK